MYTELFCIPEVTSVFISSCDSVLGESLVFHQEKSSLLTSLIGNTGLLCTQCRGIEPHLQAKGTSHGISRVASGTWVYSRVTAGMAILNSTLFSEVRTHV